MKNIKVELFRYFDQESIINASGKPYNNENADLELAEKIVNLYHHDSITEHVVFQFNITGISRLCLQELIRHRIASPTVQSSRYTMGEMLDAFYDMLITQHCWTELMLKELVEKYFVNPYNFKIENSNETEFDSYENGKIMKRLENEYIINIKNSVTSLLNERDIIREATKSGLKLPERMNDFIKYSVCEAMRTNLFWTVNLRSLRNFIKLRTSKNAHFEIRHVAELIKSIIENTEYKNFVENIS